MADIILTKSYKDKKGVWHKPGEEIKVDAKEATRLCGKEACVIEGQSKQPEPPPEFADDPMGAIDDAIEEGETVADSDVPTVDALESRMGVKLNADMRDQYVSRWEEQKTKGSESD